MHQFEVQFSVYEVNGPSRASIGVSSMQNLRTLVTANYETQARAMIEAQYGGRDHVTVYSVRRQQ